mgnify:CR=1 FL=1
MTGPTSDSAGRPVAAVVVTTHDRPELARRAVLSALTQTVPVEVVVVDDGSEPPFVDPRVRVVRTEGVGVCAARNRGLAVVDAPWVCFLDDDDELVPDALARALAAAATSDLPAPVAVLVGVEVLGPGAATGRVLCGPPALRRGDDWFLDDPAAGGRVANGLVVETAVLRAIGGFDERLRSFEHDDLGLRLNAVASVVGLDVVGYRMHSHAGPRLSARAAEGAAAMELTLAEHRRVFARHRHAHARYLARLAFQQVEAGRWAPALRWAARGVVRDPADHRTWRNLGVALAGPRGLAAFRRLSPPESTVPFSTLTARRIVKHTRPARDLARAAVGLPAARLTRVLVGRHVPPAGARPPRRALLCCVYRERNADVVARLAADATARGWSVRLWALDAEVPALAAHTVGVGPGTKFALLDRLLTDPTVDPGTFDWFVVADDDVEVDRGSIDDLLALAEAGRLDLVQPAHTERSHRELEFTVRRPVSVARRTTFVEIGPIFAFRRELLEAMVPFPVGDSMGWGLELSWFDLERAGARLGIVDAAAVRHLHPVGADYAKQAERRHLQGLLDERGLTSVLEIQKTRGVWRPWRSGPPWT